MTRGAMSYLVHQLMLEKNGSRQFSNQRDVASIGCGKEPPSITPISSIINGQTRNYITVIGNKYDKNIPMKIIFAFHGRTNPNTMVRTYYDIEKESQGNAIIIYPSGLPEE
jgi:polyhydroxybutyrate depolymerase